MSDAGTTRLAGSLVVAVFVLEVAAVALTAGVDSLAQPVIYLVYAVTQAAAGALILQRFPRHRVGWVLLVAACFNAVLSDFCLAYGKHAADAGWPLGPLAELLGMVSWTVAAAGLILLLLLFPDGRLPGRSWRWVMWVWAAGAVLALPGWALNPRLDSEFARGENPFAVDGFPADPIFALGTTLICLALVASVVSLVRRLRRATGTEREQLKWVVAAAAIIGVVLPVGGALWTVWEPIQLMAAIALMLLPLAASVAILRHRLYDVDLVIARAAAYLVILGLLAIAYAVLVALIAESSPVAAAVAAVVIALTFRPVHDRVQDVADRVFLRDRRRARASMAAFVESLRRGDSTGVDLLTAFRRATGDDELTLAFRLPDGRPVDANGAPVSEPSANFGLQLATPDGIGQRDLMTAPTGTGALLLVAHRVEDTRLAEVVLDAGRLAVEITALQMQLRGQLRDLEESRQRIQTAADDERRRLARDLHDGAQQRLVAVGLALRHSQHQHANGNEALGRSLDAAVAELTASIDELRELAGGIRPSSLDAGLQHALRELATRTPVPLDVSVPPERFPPHVEAAAYFFACEGVTNAVKHARATHISVSVVQEHGTLVVTVVDDGRGGAEPSRGSGLVGLGDRIRAHHGQISLTSPEGGGTRLEARLPCA